MRLVHWLKEIEDRIDRIQFKLEAALATAQQFTDVLKAIDTETTRIATKVQELLDKISAGGMTPAEEQVALDAATAELDRLKTIAADPANPVPAP